MKFIKIVFIITSIIIFFLCIKYFITWNIWDAIRKNHVNFVSNYLKNSGDVNFARNNQWMEGPNEQNFTLLMEAARKGKSDIVRILLENGADPNAKTSMGRTALIFAAENGNLKSVEILVEHGANINHISEGGNLRSVIDALVGQTDILGEAIFYDHVDVVEFLINQGAHVTSGHLKLAERMSKHRKNLEFIIKLLQKHLQTH